MDAETTHGKLTSDFAIEGADKDAKKHLHGVVGKDPAIDLKLHTTNGNIAIRRSKNKK